MTGVHALLGDPALARLLDRVEQRIRLGRPLVGQIVLADAEPDEQAAIARVLGRGIGSGRSVSVPLAQVDAVVRASGAAADLAAAVALLRGPVAVDSELAAGRAASWQDLLAPVDALVGDRPDVATLSAALTRASTLRRVERDDRPAAEQLVHRLVTVVRALPAAGETLPAFAARVLGDAHALHRGALRTLAELALPAFGAHPEASAAERWAAAGIALDGVASSVLVHRLPFDRGDPVGAALDALVATGQPLLVPLRMLAAGARPVAREVFVCENPAVVLAAADAHGATSAPLVCVRGQPSAAAQRLLRLLADGGAVLRYHGDFDWGGIRIANRIVERYGALPWRYRATDLCAAASVDGPALAGTRVEAVWDDDLAPAIEARGTRLEEEQVLDDLLGDLHGRGS